MSAPMLAAGVGISALAGSQVGHGMREAAKDDQTRAEMAAFIRGSASFAAQAGMAYGNFQIASAQVGANLTLGLIDAGVDTLGIFAGQYKGKGARPAKYEELLGISAGIPPPDAPQPLQDLSLIHI